jgi:3-oxoacyl-[acyl-carrier-protein] synthase II
MNRPEIPIWITGVGLATPLGNDLPTLAEGLLAGRSGVTAVTRFSTKDYPSRIAAQVESVPCPPGHDPNEFAACSRLERLALWCVDSALRDAGLLGKQSAARVGLVMGLGAEWLDKWEADFLQGGSQIRVPELDHDTIIERIARRFEIQGPYLTLSAACASSNFAVEVGRQWLRLGLVDFCLAGGCEMAVTPTSLATFGNLKALSRRNEEPWAASRPFDRNRDGFVMGEGGGVFVLERASDARRRWARVYAEVAGCGASSDAYHPVIPSPNSALAVEAIRKALFDARINADDVDHVNAHATSTPVGDAVEAAALGTVFGPALDQIPVTATKSMTGHPLTAAGAVEALACLTAIGEHAIPPTINLDDPDVDLCLVAHEARPHEVRVAVSNSFGFGGSNSCLVLRAV